MPFVGRFTDDEVRAIRQSPRSARDLAREYGVTHATILHIRERRTYKQVPDHQGHGPRNEYCIGDGLEFLRGLPGGYCETVVASVPSNRRSFSIRHHDRDDRDVMSHHDYWYWQSRVIHECIRVAGAGGMVLYHNPDWRTATRMDTPNMLAGLPMLADGLPLRQIIIWNHGGWPRLPRKRMTRLPDTYEPILMFTGRHWSVPAETAAAAHYWGTVWDIALDGDSYSKDPRRPCPFPEELAARCVALGRGMVLDPFAGRGTTVLAAIEAGRDWLACDTDLRYIEEFMKAQLYGW